MKSAHGGFSRDEEAIPWQRSARLAGITCTLPYSEGKIKYLARMRGLLRPFNGGPPFSTSRLITG